MEVVSKARIVHRWAKPLKKEKPQALSCMGSREIIGKLIKKKAGPALQNRRNNGGMLGSK